MGSPMNEDHRRLTRLVLSGYQAQVVAVFARLDLADNLIAGPLTAPELAKLSDCHEPSLLRVLRAAKYLELVKESDEGRFELSSIGLLLCAGQLGGLKNFVKMLCGEGLWRAVGRLDHTVRTGQPAFEYIFGLPGYERLPDQPREAAVFYMAALEAAHFETPPMIEACDLSGAGSVVDIGGGNGILMAGLLAANPELSGVIVDTEMGLSNASAVLSASSVAGSCQLVAGDFFTEPLPAGHDVYLIKSVLNDWNDERGAQILRNCRDVMRSDSRLLIIDSIIPDEAGSSSGDSLVQLMSDLCALVGNGGKLRTEEEWCVLLASARLKLVEVTSYQTDYGFSVLEAVPC
jgi:hypothetical protein